LSSRTDSHALPNSLSSFCAPLSICFSNVFQDGHEAEVHVQLLVAVEKHVAGIVSDKVHVDGLERHDIDDIFARAAQLRLADLGHLKGVPVKMNRMLVTAAVAKDEQVSNQLDHCDTLTPTLVQNVGQVSVTSRYPYDPKSKNNEAIKSKSL
jgi:hypothetical protein